MKIVIDKSELIQALTVGGLMSGRNKRLPVYSYSLVSVNGDSAVVSSTDGKVSIGKSCKLKESDGNMSFCVESKNMLQFLKLIKEDKEIVMKISENGSLEVVHSQGIAQFSTLPSSDFPEKEKVDREWSLRINSDLLLGWLKNAENYVPKIDTRPIMQSMFLYSDRVSGKIGYCSSDLKTLITDEGDPVSKKSNRESEDDVMGAIIPSFAFPAIKSILQGTDEINFACGSRSFIFWTDDAIVQSVVADGKYPDFKTILPKSSETKVTGINTSDFTDAVARLVVSQTAIFIKIDVFEDHMDLTAVGFSGSTSMEKVPCNSDGKTTICLLSEKLLTIVSGISSKEFEIHLNGPKQAGVFLEPDEKPDQVILLMPYCANYKVTKRK